MSEVREEARARGQRPDALEECLGQFGCICLSVLSLLLGQRPGRCQSREWDQLINC